MATILAGRSKRVRPITPDTFERILAIAAIILLAAVLTAIARGHTDWMEVPTLVWAHLLTIIVALALTPVMLLRRRGDKPHRMLGKIWVSAMTLTAFITLFVHSIRPGHFTWIHLLSVFVLVMAPQVWLSAKRRQLERHRGIVRGMTFGALVIAGYFTFPFDRLLGRWLFG
jgi:uncharacterized membrane protein